MNGLTLRPLADDVSVFGQVQPGDITALAANGFALLVDHRPDHEEPGQPTAAEMSDACAAAGVDFVHIPVSGLPSPEAVAQTAEAISAAKGKVLLFCRSGMRSTVAWARGRRLAGDDAEDLRAAALAAGYDLSSVPL